jgi:hypothetical protein
LTKFRTICCWRNLRIPELAGFSSELHGFEATVLDWSTTTCGSSWRVFRLAPGYIWRTTRLHTWSTSVSDLLQWRSKLHTSKLDTRTLCRRF